MRKQRLVNLWVWPSRVLLRALLAPAVLAIAGVTGLLLSMPALPVQADPGDGAGIVLLPAGQQPVPESLSPEARSGLNTILHAVPEEQRPLLINAFGALGPAGAEATLRVYASLPPEMVGQEFSYLSSLIQNWPPNYQQALLIDYLLNQGFPLP